MSQALRRHASFLPARASLTLLEEAVWLAETSGRRPLQARVLTSYGAALQRAGKPAEARAILYSAADLAGELGMERLRERAFAALVQAGGRPRRQRLSGPASLTDAQHQVADLAAAGLTNREIAEQLFVTIKTVETHLNAVYRKTSASADGTSWPPARESPPQVPPLTGGPSRATLEAGSDTS